MKRKIISIIFSIGLIAIVVTTGITMLKNDKNMNSGDGQLSTEKQTDEELVSLDDEQLDEQKALKEEHDAYGEKHYKFMSEPETYTGGYKNHSLSIEINPDFITDEHSFRQIWTYNEIEFLGYEELSDISEYIDKEGWDIVDTGEYYIEKGIINEDGTFNKVTKTVTSLYSDRDYGEETVLENQELVAVKLRIKYTNLLEQENVLDYYSAHQIFELTYLDDGKLYAKGSVYYSNFFPDMGPICINTYDKCGYVGTIKCENLLVLGPKEEYIGELIYLFLKEDLDDAYFCIDSGYHGGTNDAQIWQNFKSVGVHFLPLTELKKLEGK